MIRIRSKDEAKQTPRPKVRFLDNKFQPAIPATGPELASWLKASNRTPADYADMLGLSRATAYNHLKAEHLPKIARMAIAAWKANLTV